MTSSMAVNSAGAILGKGRALTKIKGPGMDFAYNGTVSGEDLDKAARAVLELRERVKDEVAQMLAWKSLPLEQQQQLSVHEAMIGNIKNKTGAEHMTLVGIGGSLHPVDAALGLNGLNLNKEKVDSYVGFTKQDFEIFMAKRNHDITNEVFMFVSKSGTTPEIQTSLKFITDELTRELKAKGYSKPQIEEHISNHFIVVTDKNPDKSKLRSMARENGWQNQATIHDGVGGRFSINDDHVILALMWAGMPKKEINVMLQGSADMVEHALYKPVAENIVAYRSAVIEEGLKNGLKPWTFYNTAIFDNYETYTKQQEMESQKLESRIGGFSVVPKGNHYGLESWANKANPETIINRVPVLDSGMNPELFKNYSKMIGGFAQDRPSIVETVESENTRLKPYVVGSSTMADGLTTVIRDIIYQSSPLDKPIPAVLQPAVEAYKKANQKGLDANRMAGEENVSWEELEKTEIQ